MSADFRRISLTLGKGTTHIREPYYRSKIVPKAYHKIGNERNQNSENVQEMVVI